MLIVIRHDVESQISYLHFSSRFVLLRRWRKSEICWTRWPIIYNVHSLKSIFSIYAPSLPSTKWMCFMNGMLTRFSYKYIDQLSIYSHAFPTLNLTTSQPRFDRAILWNDVALTNKRNDWRMMWKCAIFKKIQTEVKTFRDKVSRFAWERARQHFP